MQSLVVMFLPRALSSLADAQTAVQRLGEFFESEITTYKANIDLDLEVAIRVQDATFEWVAGEETLTAHKLKANKKKKVTDTATPPRKDSAAKPFRIENLNFTVPRGQLVAIVGPVSCLDLLSLHIASDG
jgi:ATP-binding cassette subfamily C (CFTR/MRP) protein 1